MFGKKCFLREEKLVYKKEYAQYNVVIVIVELGII